MSLIPNKILVELQDRSYEIVIDKNAIAALPHFLAQRSYSKIFVITDENVAKLYPERIQRIVENSQTIILPSGERTKSFEFLEKVCEEILSKAVDRKSLIIAFGGGVVGDLAGFVSSILLRGIDFIQIPTTLLAMVDSSVGGKTAINSRFGKNLIGSFYQPKLVICDLVFLKTLPIRELRAGYAEIVKYGFIRDKNFFEFLAQNHDKIFSGDENILQKAIRRSCEIKAAIVGLDERESGERALLNFGHTFGHIFETEAGYSNEILHGEAVALGMVMAAKMSQNFGLISRDDFSGIASHLASCGFVIDPKKIRKNWNEKNLLNHLLKDKKNEGQKLTFILLEKIGEAIVKRGVELDEFLKVWRSF